MPENPFLDPLNQEFPATEDTPGVPDELKDEYIPKLEDLRDVLPITSGRDVDPVPKIPDAPDISPAPKKSKVPPILNNSIEGLAKLHSDELPDPKRHFVIWGSAHLDDIKPRRVRRSCPVTEDAHAAREVEHTKVLLAHGLKNPKVWTDSKTGKPLLDTEKGQPGAELWDRVRRTEHYARWRYKGYVCGVVVSL